MGAYLSQPKTDKVSTDENSERLMIGASSMQGWRNSQEDAHNAIINFDENTSFFAVYDGHGGAEVATYCADRLPEFLKNLELYKYGQLEEALRKAFLEFDRTLLEPEVIEVLKILAGERNVEDSDNMEDEEDLIELHQESHLPLNEVLEKYKGHPSMPILSKIRNESAGSSSGQKPQSPYLRGRRTAAIVAQATNKALMDPDSKPQGSSTSAAALAALNNDTSPSSSGTSKSKEHRAEPVEDFTVSSSSSGSNAAKNHNSIFNNNSSPEAEAAITNGAIKSAEATATLKPDSSHPTNESEQNGSVTSSEAKAIITSTATSSKLTGEDATVSGSNDDATVAAAVATATATKHNGSVDSSTAVGEKSSPAKVEAGGAISSTTSKDTGKLSGLSALSGSPCEEDEEDAEYQVNKSNEYSSEEEVDDDDDDDDEEDVDGNADDDDENGSDADTDEFDEEDDEEDDDEEMVMANQQFCNDMIEEPGKDSGCTAVVALLHGRDLYVANAGDSRCVVCRKGKAIEMSLDHKPEDEEESARIIKAGGRVTLDGRVNGGLNLSRAIGDHAYKMNVELALEDQMISARPDIKKLIITPEDEFMVLACDGIWNFMSSDEVVEFVRKRLLDDNKRVSEICEELFDHCLAPDTMGDGTGCDNMTAVIVRFKPKILELPTFINPAETEDALKKQCITKTDEQHGDATDSTQKAQKRLASSNRDSDEDDDAADGNTNEAEHANKNKRLKTDNDDKSNAMDDAADATNSVEIENIAKSIDSCSTTTMQGAGSEENECDSVVSTASIATPITPAVSTT